VAVFVINEWLWADSSGDNGRDNQRQALSLIENLLSSDHQIVVVEDSQFDRKAWNLCRSTNLLVQAIAAAFVKNIRWNSDRCLILKPNETVAVPGEIALVTKADDHYLIQAQLTVNGAILVTTDGDLRTAVRNAGLACLWRDEFLATCF
jgi:hypothetical protein